MPRLWPRRLVSGRAPAHSRSRRHRVLWLREMSEEDIRKVGETEPTIDSIQIAEFDSHDALKEWLGKTAPAFLR